MWLGLTIARSSPASTQWCRKTELSTDRAGWETPKLTFETPSEVLTPGSASLIALIPSIVSTADGRHSSSPVVSVKVSASKISSSRVEAVLRAGVPVDPLARPRPCGRGCLRHALLVDRQRDHRGAVATGQRHHQVELVATGLEVDRVDDRPARNPLERGLDHLGLGRVDLKRRGLGQRDALDHRAHLRILVLALGQRDAEIEHVRATADLILGDRDQAVVVVGEQQLLGPARALRVDPLADQGRGGLLDQVGRGHHRRQARRPGLGTSPGYDPGNPLGEGGDVLRSRATAAADQTYPVALDELAEHGGDLLRGLGEDRLAVGALDRQTGVGDAVHRQRRVLPQIADRIAHVLGTGRAVEAEDVHLHALGDREHGLDVGAEQHLAAVRQQRDRDLDRHAAGDALERFARAGDSRPHLEDVLGGLDDQSGRRRLRPGPRLLVEDLGQLGRR